MSQTIVQVDAFTSEPFQGNPAAICVLEEARDEAWMAAVAREMNLSETAFLQRRGDGDWDLRWFTPVTEVNLCGHATLASAHTLWTEGHLTEGTEIRFHTRSGVLGARRDGAWIELDFPSEPPEAAEVPAGLLEAIGVSPRWVGRNRMDYLLELESETQVRELRPDFGRLAHVPARGVIITSRAVDEPFHFISRFFAPTVGVPEDPVTGSAHCCLTPFWAQRLGCDEMLAYQASARGGIVRVRQKGERVRLAGTAVTVLRGELL